MAPPPPLVLLPLLLVAVSAGNIPEYIQVCKKNDSNINECIKKSIENLRPQLVKGIPELDVPKLEPLVLPVVEVAQGDGKNRFRAVGHNVKVYGPGNFRLNSVKADIKKHIFTAELEIPSLYFEAEYDVNAQLLNVPIKGRGPLHANATDCRGEITLKGQLVKRDGAVYLYFYNIDVTVDVKQVQVHLEGLFNGDRVLGEATNQALNDNSQDFWPTVKPIVERTIASEMLDRSNKITSHFKYEELFPE